MIVLLKIAAIVIFVPLAGGILTGADRILTARMQSRKGPPLLQPFYDVIKLFQKETTEVAAMTQYFIAFALCFDVFTVVLFFMGNNFLLVIFAYTIACIFFILAGFSSYSPYSHVGAEREILQIMCYEPMILVAAFGFYEALGTFHISGTLNVSSPLILKLPLIFLGLTYVLTVKLRKSPFDLSMSHHGHQELVSGITTEMTGRCRAAAEVIHWYETVFAMGLVYIFFVYASPHSHLIAAAACLLIYFAEIVIDNIFSRVRWQFALKLSWAVTVILGGSNLLLINFFT
jgi:ech hydrogenase subunit B